MCICCFGLPIFFLFFFLVYNIAFREMPLFHPVGYQEAANCSSTHLVAIEMSIRLRLSQPEYPIAKISLIGLGLIPNPT
jgi:hypothetical protein